MSIIETYLKESKGYYIDPKIGITEYLRELDKIEVFSVKFNHSYYYIIFKIFIFFYILQYRNFIYFSLKN